MDLSSSPFAPAGIARNPAAASSGAAAESPQETANSAFSRTLFGEDGFNFFDILDAINPLQHIPIISTIYRRATGDDLSAASRVAGGALFGGFVGLGSAAFNALVEANTGKDLGEHVASLILDDGVNGDTPVMVAELPASDAPWYRSGQVRYVAAAEMPSPEIQTASAALQDTPNDDAPHPVPRSEGSTPWYLSGSNQPHPPVAKAEELAFALPSAPEPLVAEKAVAEPLPLPTPPAQAVNAGLSSAVPIDPVTVSTLADAIEAPGAQASPQDSVPPLPVDFTNAMLSALEKYQASQNSGQLQGGQVNLSR